MNRLLIARGVSMALGVALVAGCGSAPSKSAGVDGGAPVVTSVTGDASVPSLGGDLDDGGAGATQAPVVPTGPVTDFPAPIFDGNAPSSSAALFGPSSQGAQSGGPCLVEPSPDVLYPQNWLRPRFTWNAANGETLFELRLHVANQLQDLLVYTTSTTWTMPAATWDALRAHSPTEAMTISVRGGVLSGTTLQSEALGSSVPMGIAPVQAAGAIVYWTIDDTTTDGSALKGFSPGDESVETVLTPANYQSSQGATSKCIGCHTSSPDGEYAAFTSTVTSGQDDWHDALGLIDPTSGTVGSAPSYMTSAGAAALARPNVGAVAFSPAHWQDGDRHAIVSYDNDNSGTNIVLSWIDVAAASAATASGTLARDGDTQLAGAPAWSHDGTKVAYVSTNRVCTGRLGNCTPQYTAPADPGSRAALYTVPWNGGAGGTATAVPGASDPTLQEYYPSFSPDDALLVFNRVPNDDNLYDQAASEVFVIPSAGGTATRLAANDPAACSGVTSPGVTNSWGKWGPTALQANGNTYYWLVFSSKRANADVAQLYITSIVADGSGALTTHGALYLWNQPATESNHTPAWDTFKVPPIAAPK